MRLALAALTLAVLTTPAPADEIDCTDPQTQTDMTLCATAEFDAADDELNVLYGRIRERLAGESDKLALLRDAQRAWIAYRDAECAFRSSGVEGGSAQPMVEAQCSADVTTRRNADLKAMLACEEGDVSCPVPLQ